MNQSQGQQQSWTGRMGANQQRQANLGKNQRPKYGNYQQHTASNFFGTNRTVSSFAGKPPPKIGNTRLVDNFLTLRSVHVTSQQSFLGFSRVSQNVRLINGSFFIGAITSLG
jgi:hypothetical protein